MGNFKFDTHMHLDLFAQREDIIKYIEEEKSYTIAMTNLPILYSKYINMYKDLRYIRFALGFHPELVYEYENQISIFLENLKYAKYIGEIGLDYKIKNPNNIDAQNRVFKRIIRNCKLRDNKVVSVHSRLAASDVNSIIGKFNGTIIMHWFTGNKDELNKSIDNGYYFSINEKMLSTDKKKFLIRNIPIDKLLLESDAPFTSKSKTYSINFMNNIIRDLSDIYKLEPSDMREQLKRNFITEIDV